MNYTENYHLPQWVKTDRIMMDDFNQMCADIEKGLNRNMTTAGKGLTGLRRLTYNHLRAMWRMDPLPNQWGAFCHSVKNTPGRFTGNSTSHDFLVACDWEGSPTREDFMSWITETQQLYLSATEARPLILDFQPQAGGYIMNLGVIGPRTATNPLNAAYLLTLTNLDTGKEEFRLKNDFNFPVGTSGGIYTVPFQQMFFHSGCHYEIRLQPLSTDATAQLSLDKNGNWGANFFKPSGASAVHTFEQDETSQGGLVFVSCGAHAAGGTVSLKLNEQEVPVSLTLQRFDDSSAPTQEHIYLIDGEIPGGSNLSLSVTANEGGEVDLYGWGASLF